MLFQIPQRYRFSSKSQHIYPFNQGYIVVLDTTKVQIFKQITTTDVKLDDTYCCFRYHKGTDFQANHNKQFLLLILVSLFQIPQRYRFSSKSQPHNDTARAVFGCFRYHKGTDFQANHNLNDRVTLKLVVVLDTTKVQIFKQITTIQNTRTDTTKLFQIPQRYRFSSKSQRFTFFE